MRDRRIDFSRRDFHPRYVVWELTLACDQGCTHCGSRAARPRQRELSTEEALRVVEQLAQLGAREVVLMGGEAYLHPGLVEIVAALSARGIRPLMVTGGRALRPDLCQQLASAGMHSVSVSIDGLEQTHVAIRGPRDSFDNAKRALGALADAGIKTAANTNINQLNKDELEALYEELRSLGVCAWQLQLTAALGRAADQPEMLLQPFEFLDLMPRIAELKRQAYVDEILLMPGNNLGYFGPEEALLRSQQPDGRDHWVGCQAGRFGLGLQSDGGVKGCCSLQERYVDGNVREWALADIWRDSEVVGFTRSLGVESLWGYCRSCDYAEVCLGGCAFTAHALFGRPGNNPYCHYRALQFAAAGKRERLIRTKPAPGRPFDHGQFELVVEAGTADIMKCRC